MLNHVKVYDKHTEQLVYEGDIEIEDGLFYFPMDANVTPDVLIEVNGCMVEPLRLVSGVGSIRKPRPEPKILKIGYEGDWQDLKECPCCRGNSLSETLDEDYCGNLFQDGVECDNCGWSTYYLTCSQQHYLEFLIKQPKNIINKNI